MTSKRCNTCKIEKPIREFNRHSGLKDGLQPKCRQCTSEYTQYYKEKRKAEGVLVMVGSKVCARCNMEKPRSSYNKRTVSRDGLGIYCKTCVRLLRSKYAR